MLPAFLSCCAWIQFDLISLTLVNMRSVLGRVNRVAQRYREGR